MSIDVVKIETLGAAVLQNRAFPYIPGVHIYVR